MRPSLMELFRELRNEVSSGYEKGVIPQEISENLLHIIHNIEFELRTEKDAEAIFRDALISRIGGLRNEMHELNRNLEKHLKRK